MKTNSYILIDHDPDGRTGEVTSTPFAIFYASPFIIKGNKLYALDRQTGKETGPFDRAVYYGMSYAVYRGDKGGIIDLEGQPVIDCKYDNVYGEGTHIYFHQDGKEGYYCPCEGLLYPWHGDFANWFGEE